MLNRLQTCMNWGVMRVYEITKLWETYTLRHRLCNRDSFFFIGHYQGVSIFEFYNYLHMTEVSFSSIYLTKYEI